MNIRICDTVISKNAIEYEVDRIEDQSIICFEKERQNIERSFEIGDLFCVDAQDGLWQEME